MSSPSETPSRNALIAVVGRTNSGKSTLVNRLVGDKVSIVSPVVQTTRNTIRGILDEPRGQLVLADTPGLHKAEGPLGTLLNRMARHTSANAEILLIVFDASHPPQLEDDGWMRRATGTGQPLLFLLNKADRSSFHAEEFHRLWETVSRERPPQSEPRWFEASAATGEGLAPLVDALFELATPGPRPFDRQTLSDHPRRLVVADIIREQYLRHLSDELPHEIGIRVDDLDEDADGWRVAASVLVNRPSQKPIVIGTSGQLVRRVESDAAREITRQYEVPVKLSLRIKVEKNWMASTWILKQMGYAGEH